MIIFKSETDRVQIKLRFEYERYFLAIYVDFKKSFNTIDCSKSFSEHTGFIGTLSLISALNTNTESIMKSWGGISHTFPIDSEESQGCVLDPLF